MFDMEMFRKEVDKEFGKGTIIDLDAKPSFLSPDMVIPTSSISHEYEKSREH